MVLKWFLIGCRVTCVVRGYAATLQKNNELHRESFHLAFSPVKRSDCGDFKSTLTQLLSRSKMWLMWALNISSHCAAFQLFCEPL